MEKLLLVIVSVVLFASTSSAHDDHDCRLECYTETSSSDSELTCDMGYIPVGCTCFSSSTGGYTIDLAERECQCKDDFPGVRNLDRTEIRCCKLINTEQALQCEWRESGKCRLHEQQITSCSSKYNFFYVSEGPQKCEAGQPFLEGGLCCTIGDSGDYELKCDFPENDLEQSTCPKGSSATSCSCHSDYLYADYTIKDDQCYCKSISGAVLKARALCCRCQRKQHRDHH